MSPAPLPTQDDTEALTKTKDISEMLPYIKDAIIASILGGFAMAARILLSTEPVTFGYAVRRFLAASITASLVGLGTKDYFSSQGLWLAVVGGSGYAAPEVADYFLRWVKAKGEQKVKEATRGIKTKKTKKRK
jgi:hypothetical protein